jgi:hypothetical protein
MGTNAWHFTWLKIKIVGLLFLSNCRLFAQLCHYCPIGRCFSELELQLWESDSIVWSGCSKQILTWNVYIKVTECNLVNWGSNSTQWMTPVLELFLYVCASMTYWLRLLVNCKRGTPEWLCFHCSHILSNVFSLVHFLRTSWNISYCNCWMLLGWT